MKPENEIKKWSFCLMNPPYGDATNGGMFLDMQFVEKVNEICEKQIVIHPFSRWISNTKIGKNNAENKHLKKIDVINANDAFNISSNWVYGGIFIYDNINEYNETQIDFDEKNIHTSSNLSWKERRSLYDTMMKPQDLYKVIQSKESLYKELLKKYNTMVNDGHGFIYEENRLQRGKNSFGITKKDQNGLSRVKSYLKEGIYKYCLYKGSGNHNYDEVQEWCGQDPDKLFNGQMCWLTNKENIKNNIKYWMECPLFDLWRFYYMYGWKMATMCAYGKFPALDFEMTEDKFKEYVDSLNDFTDDEIKILKEHNIHNANKL